MAPADVVGHGDDRRFHPREIDGEEPGRRLKLAAPLGRDRDAGEQEQERNSRHRRPGPGKFPGQTGPVHLLPPNQHAESLTPLITMAVFPAKKCFGSLWRRIRRPGPHMPDGLMGALSGDQVR